MLPSDMNLNIGSGTAITTKFSYLMGNIDAKSPAESRRLQLSDSISSSPAEQAKSPAELGLTNFVIHISRKLLFHKPKTVHDLRNRQIYEKSVAN